METQAKFIALALCLTIAASPLAHAQNPDGPLPVPGDRDMSIRGQDRDQRRADGPGRKHGKPGAGRDGRNFGQGPGWNHNPGGLTSLTTVSGTVGQLLGNDDAILDGFTLNTGSGQATTVKFPPHLGEQVQKAVKVGSTVSVSGFTDKTPTGESLFRMNSLTIGKTTVMDAPPVHPVTPPTPLEVTTVTGKIADYRLDRGGRVNALVLDNKTVVSIPAHVAYQLTDLAKKGNTITVQGYPKQIHAGQVQLEKVNVIRASVLTINGQQYLVR
ncbi:hypothetical protein [Spirosoma sp.]|uniref:hypothetical protein n=1 Tax=Spirosoma sp. TaxID=1899569 RepID=UPI0026392367|nr:hypothetical protein [Spirosoma sp.]MCX6217123.1 hypothetical protein [Spirosoma sp.]